jgi:ligand-binding sensor domain-containing protein/two-component sensor histidine kinase
MGFLPRNVHKLFLCLQFILLFAEGFTQTYYTSIKTFGEPDGFHITEGITNMSQDKKGFIWISSRNGLYRFNGTSFKHFKHIVSDSFSLPANEVNFCFQDKDGDYWVGISKMGLYQYDDKTERFTLWKNKNFAEIDMSKLYNIIAPFEDSHGQLWFSAATRGIISVNKKEKTVKLFNVCDHYNTVDLYRSCLWVNQFAEDRNGWFWLCSNDGMIHFNPSIGDFKVYRNGNEFTSYFTDSEGQGWIATWGGGLKTLDVTTNSWKQYTWTTAGPIGTKNIVISILEKDKDHLWISSLDNGLMIFDKRDGHFTQIHAQSKTDNFLSATTALLADREQNIWVIAKEQLGRINGKNLLQYESLSDNGSDKTSTCFLHLPGDSLVFIGAIYSKEGLHVYNLRTRKISIIPLGITSETEDIKDFFVDSKKQIWIGTAKGIYLLNRKTLKTKKFVSPSAIYQKFFESSFDKILEDQQHRVWFASRWWGLFQYDPLKNTIVHYSSDSSGGHHIPFNQFHYASLDKEQNLWLSMHSYLLEQPPVFCITPGGKIISYVNKIPLDAAPQVIATKTNKTLIATTFSGIFEIQNALQPNESIKRYDEDDGIADTYVEGFTEDKNGNLWITTHNGLSCLSKNRIVSFHMADGLADNFLEAPPYCDEDNTIFLPFKNGFQYFNADSLLQYHQPIGPVILESLFVNQKNYEENPNQIKKLDLKYNENNLSLEFAAFDLSQGDKLQYAYQLQGSDTKWTNLGDNRQLFFSNLSPGSYKLKLRAGDRFGNWSKQELILPITIRPPFWKTWWFYSLCLLFAFTVVYFIYRMRINSLVSEQKLRNKIARDLHDDIGSTLSGIKLFSNMAQTKLVEERSEATNIVERIGERSEKMIDAMSDIVWSINPVNDSVENMLVRMKQYAAEMLEPKNINYTFYVDDKVKKTRFGLETRKDIYLVFKESINNAVKYSECRNLRVDLQLLKKSFEITITDDGKGFDTSKNGSGNGLNNFKQRANNLGGEIIIYSKENEGTIITLKVPLT